MRLVRVTSLVLTALAAATLALAQDAQSHGKELFANSCAYCHGERGYATAQLAKRLGPANALLEARTNLPAVYVRTVVRHGIGGMPWYRRAELSDTDLDAIVAYLTRTQPPQ